MPKTSIIILTCDNLEYNKLCIESIRQYTEQGTYEIIVVDNNSTDGTVEWLKQQEDIKLILNYENLGFPKGCNQGIKLAEERNDILLLNNDTIVTPNWLKNLKSCLYSDVNIGAVAPVTNNSSYYQAITVNYTNIKEMIEFSETFNIMDTEKWEQRIKLVGYCMLIKRNVVDKIGLLDERFTPGNFEDDDYSIRIQEAGYKLILCKDTFIHHFGSATFENANYNYSKLIERNLKKFEEKWGFNPFYSTIIRDEIIDLIDADRDKKINVLEVGCACGATLLKIKDLYKNANIYGIEFDSVPAKIASNYADIKAEDVENSELSYEKNYFDYIIFADVLEHLYNPDIVLQNMKNYLKNDGKILISIPNIMHFSIIKGLLNQSFEYEDSGILDKTHIRFFTIKDLYKMISKIGYKIDRTVIKEYPQYSEDDDVFMKKLFELNKGSKNIKDWEFRAYQYLLVLKK
ncbi:MAG: methyltransferase domain-containing protein [Tissierellia bacterium]|nr:methyltransferase domain-containing protein [Tissierellia bacterium]